MARARIIAHRGASGHAPEHTIAAKCLAYGMGADFLEQDIIATRDGALVVLHDLHLDDVSDVADRFPGRARPEDGRHYVIDFDLSELRELRLTERRQPGAQILKFPERCDARLDGLRILSFEEELALIRSLNRTTGRDVGVYPEIKDPEWHARSGIDLAGLIIATLRRHGYADRASNAYLQSFSLRALETAMDLDCGIRRVYLLEDEDVTRIDAMRDGWTRVAEVADGIGLPFGALIREPVTDGLRPSPLVERLRAAGLEVHPYTMRVDEPGVAGFDQRAIIAFLVHEVGVDGLFCDQPDAALSIRDGDQGQHGQVGANGLE